MHCYSGSKEMMERFLKLGCYISFSGVVTFKNAKSVKEVASFVPLDKLLIETDDPYLTPHPFRGQKNQPAYVYYVAEEIARIKNLSVEEIAQITTNNAKGISSMKKIKEIIIVEGKSDKQFLQSFLDADIFTCNGSAIDGFDIEFIKNLAKKGEQLF